MRPTTRRRVLTALAAAPLLALSGRAFAAAPRILVHKDPNCGCCAGWVEHMRADGFAVEVAAAPDLAAVKDRLRVPAELAACHTAQVGRFVIEGHVPASAVRRLLAEMPAATGLAVPGMPVGSPGMEVGGAASVDYEVILFGPGLRRTFAFYRAATEVSR